MQVLICGFTICHVLSYAQFRQSCPEDIGQVNMKVKFSALFLLGFLWKWLPGWRGLYLSYQF